MGEEMSISKRKSSRRFLILSFFTIALAFLVVPMITIAYQQPNSSLDSGVVFEQSTDSPTPKPGDEVSLTITYLNNMSEAARNVTIFEWMPTGLTFISSKPFYDGASDAEAGFYRWSRGNIVPHESGTVTVKAVVQNVPVGTNITIVAHLTYEHEDGATVELTSSESLIVAQGASVDVYPDEIHGIPPSTNSETSYNITVCNRGNAPDVFNVSLSSITFDPTPAGKQWTIELYNSTGTQVATLKDEASKNHSSWTKWGTLTTIKLQAGESTRFTVRVIEPGGTSGSGDAYVKVRLTATSQFDAGISDTCGTTTVVRKKVGITLAPDNVMEANPGETVAFPHELYNGGQTEVIDLSYNSMLGWTYTFCFANGTILKDTDNDGNVDVGEIAKNSYLKILVKTTVPYGTAANVTDEAVVTAMGVSTGNYDSANETTRVKSAPVLGVAKNLLSSNPRYFEDEVTYHIRITNLGNTRLTKIPLHDAYETLSLNFSSASPAEDSYNEVAGTVHWENLTALDPGQSAQVTVNFVATGADDTVRQSANVIDAEDEFGNLISATYMNTELKIIGLYSLTVTALPAEAMGGGFTVAWTERGVQNEGVFTTPTSIMCDQDTVAAVSHADIRIDAGDVRYIFAFCSPSDTVLMDSDKTIVLNYRTEYKLTFNQIGSLEPVYVVVNGTQLPQALPHSFWVAEGSIITFKYSSPLTDAVGTTRYVLVGVSGNTTASTVTVNAPTSITGLYKTQHYLTVDSPYSAPGGEGWYDKYANAYATLETGIVDHLNGTRRLFSHWSGDASGTSYAASNPIYMDGPKTAAANWKTQHLITFTQTGLDETADNTILIINGAPVNLSDLPLTLWADQDSSLSFRYTGIVSSMIPCKRFRLDTISHTSLLFKATEPMTIAGNYKPQHQLTVRTNGLDANFANVYNDTTILGTATDSTSYSGWFDEGSWLLLNIDDLVADGSTRFVFTRWSGSASGALQPLSLIVSSAQDIVVNYRTQYEITFIQSGLSTDFTGTVVTIDETGYSISDLPVAFWWDENSQHEFSFSSVLTVDSGKRYIWTSTSGLSTLRSETLTIAGSGIVTGNYGTQYQVTFAQDGAGLSFSGMLVSINSEDYGLSDLPVSFYWNEGFVATFKYSSLVTDAVGTTRYVLVGVSGNTTASTVTVNAPTSITGLYKTQHYLEVTTNPPELDAPGYNGWYDRGTYAKMEVETPTGGDGISTRYRFHNWIGEGVEDLTEASTRILMDAPKTAEANFIAQFYLTTSTNFGYVNPHSGWHDAGSTVLIEAFAPEVVEGEGYVWYGWTGTGEESYSGVVNPATVTMNSAVSETAYWRIAPELTVFVSNETITNCDRVVVYGRTLPVHSRTWVEITYSFPNGTQATRSVQTDDEGRYNDTLLLGEESLYGLFAQGGEWLVLVHRSGNIDEEAAASSATLEVEAPPTFQIHPAIPAGITAIVVAIVYILIRRREKNNKNTQRSWRRATAVLGIAGLTFGAASLVLNWMAVAGTTTANGQTYLVNIVLRPLHGGLVHITELLQYTGAGIPSMVDSAWWSLPKSIGPVITLYLLPIGCVLVLTSLYKPKTERQRRAKMLALVTAGVLMLVPVIHTLVFMQAHANAITGATTGYDVGIYIATIGGVLAVLSSLFAAKETQDYAPQISLALSRD